MQVLHNAEQYKTSVTIRVVCNEAAALRNVVHTWDSPLAVSVYQSQNLDNDTSKYNLLWEHREVMQAAASSGASLHETQLQIPYRKPKNGTVCCDYGTRLHAFNDPLRGAPSFWLSVDHAADSSVLQDRTAPTSTWKMTLD